MPTASFHHSRMRGRSGSTAASRQVPHSSFSSMRSSPRSSVTLSQTFRSEQYSPLRLFRLIRSRFLLTVLETSAINPLVFIAYYGLHRMEKNSSISNSVVDSCLVAPPLPQPSHSSVRIPSYSNPLPSVFNQLHVSHGVMQSKIRCA